MARRHDVRGTLGWVNRHGYGVRPVMRGDAGGDALARLNGNGESGLVPRAVGLRHQLKPQLVRAVLRHCHANQPASEFSHEIDRFRRCHLRRNDQVALILAIFGINKNDHLAIAGIFNNVFGWRQILAVFRHLRLLRYLSGAQRSAPAHQFPD